MEVLQAKMSFEDLECMDEGQTSQLIIRNQILIETILLFENSYNNLKTMMILYHLSSNIIHKQFKEGINNEISQYKTIAQALQIPNQKKE